MVFQTWWTDEAFTTDTVGVCQLRASLGDYEIVVEHGGRTAKAKATVDKSGRVVTIEL